jgi:HEAT repeat protein
LASQIIFALAIAAGTPTDYEFTTDTSLLKVDAARELVGQLGDPKKGRDAARRLARFRHSAVKPTIAALRSKNLQTRFYAATVLDIIGDEAGTKALFRRLADENEDPIVRTVAARAMGNADYSPATDALVSLAKTYSAADDESGEVDVLADNEEFRFEVVRALACIGADEADELLTSALADDSARIRAAAAQGLGDHRVIAALGPLRDLLEDSDGKTAAAAAKAIGKMGRRAAAAAPDLIAALERKDVRVRRAVIGALALTTGRSHRTPERWRKWWKDRNAARTASGEAKVKDNFPLPAVMATDIFSRRATGARRPERSSGTPASERKGSPALRMPWDTNPDDKTDAPTPRD